MSNEEMVFEGLSKADAMTTMIGEYGMGYNEALASWKENGSKASVGFAAGFYDRLRESNLGDEEFNLLIDAGSNNVKNHRGHYDAIRVLANDVRGS